MSAVENTYAADAFFVAGGTLSASAPSYVERAVDGILVGALLEGSYVYVLDTRQIGKSSLVTRAAETLRSHGIRVATLDLTRIGSNLSPAQWYMSLLARIDESLRLGRACTRAYAEEPDRPPMERFFNVLEKVALGADPSRLIIVIDEIDVVLSLPFSADEFFAGIRECFVRRATQPDLGQLSFCLVGSASPATLIRDVRITPFNIGVRLEPTDFTLAELKPYASALSASDRDGRCLVERVHYWTNGHPYLTQLLCNEISRDTAIRSPRDVDRLVDELFLSASAREADHLALAARRILESDEGLQDRDSLLDLLRRMHRKSLPDDPADSKLTALKLAGVVRGAGGSLAIRNNLYRRYFGKNWIGENSSSAELIRRHHAVRVGQLKVAAIAVAVIGVLMFFGLRERTARAEATRTWYWSSLPLIQQAVDSGQAQRALELVDETGTSRFDGIRGPEWHYWNVSTNAGTLVDAGPSSSGAFSRDGSQFAIRGEKTVSVFDSFSFKPTPGNVGQLRESQILAAPDGGWFGAMRGRISKVGGRNSWSQGENWMAGGASIRPTSVNIPGRTSCSLSRDGKFIALPMSSGVSIFEADSGKELKTLQTNNEAALAWHPTENKLAVAEINGNITIWNPVTGAQAGPVLYSGVKITLDLEYSPQGGLLAICGENPSERSYVALIEISSQRITKLYGHFGAIYTVAFSPDGTSVVTAGEDGTVRIWNAYTGKQIGSFLSKGRMLFAEFSPRGERVLAGGDEGTRMWDSIDLLGTQQVAGHVERCSDRSASPDGGALLAFKDRRLVELKEGQETQSYPIDGYIVDMGFSPNGKFVGAITSDSSVYLFSRDGKVISQFKLSSRFRGLSITFSADSRYALAADDRGTTRRIETSTGEIERIDLARLLDSVEISPDGTSILTVSIGQTALFDIATGSDLATFGGQGDKAGQIATASGLAVNRSPNTTKARFSPDGSRVIVLCEDLSIRQYDIDGAQYRFSMLGHSDVITSLSIGAKGRRLATSSLDGSIRLWEMETGRELLTIRQPGAKFKSVALSESGTELVALTTDGGLVCYPLTKRRSAPTAQDDAALAAQRLHLATEARDAAPWRFYDADAKLDWSAYTLQVVTAQAMESAHPDIVRIASRRPHTQLMAFDSTLSTLPDDGTLVSLCELFAEGKMKEYRTESEKAARSLRGLPMKRETFGRSRSLLLQGSMNIDLASELRQMYAVVGATPTSDESSWIAAVLYRLGRLEEAKRVLRNDRVGWLGPIVLACVLAKQGKTAEAKQQLLMMEDQLPVVLPDLTSASRVVARAFLCEARELLNMPIRKDLAIGPYKASGNSQ